MKITTTIILLFILSLPIFAQKTEIETKIENINFQKVKEGGLTDYNFVKQTKGKITIIEFWETWCGPCIQGMWHLKALQNKFPELLKVICVSSDDLDKTQKFIAKNDFPFDFIHDKDKSLSAVFPHSGIPHTILINKNGEINTETYPGYITDEIILSLNKNEFFNLPQKKNFDPAKLNIDDSNSLIKFDLKRFELGERTYVEESKKEVPVQIVTGYSGKAYIDTTEVIQQCTITGKNALEIYQYAYDYIPLSRFKYDESLEDLNSNLPNLKYKLIFSSSSTIGDFKELLISQLNSLWRLKTRIVEKECDYYELVSITLKEGTIMDKPDNNIKITGRTVQSFRDLVTSSVRDAESIATMVENQIVHLQSNKYHEQEDMKVYYPVITNLTGTYALNLAIQDDSSSVSKWIELLAENGLYLEKKHGKIKYVFIEK